MGGGDALVVDGKVTVVETTVWEDVDDDAVEVGADWRAGLLQATGTTPMTIAIGSANRSLRHSIHRIMHCVCSSR